MNAPLSSLHSPQTGTEYRLQFLAPEIARDPGPWPAVLVLDGDDQFEFAVGAYEELRAAGRVEPLLLVGVGYGASYREPANRRIRDYTPTRLEEEPGSGGGDAFLAFLTDTLWPELQRYLPVRDDRRGIVGHSLGSLLALHALFQPRPFFSRVLASAPSLWWDNRVVLCRAQQLRARQAALPARLFLSVGGKDSESMRLDLELLGDQLAAGPFTELDVVREDFPARTHYDLLVDSFRAGLQALYPAQP
jgi:predicted alpha/beta superfamily hydrolase